MKKAVFVLVAAVLIASLLLISCAKPASSPTPTGTATPTGAPTGVPKASPTPTGTALQPVSGGILKRYPGQKPSNPIGNPGLISSAGGDQTVAVMEPLFLLGAKLELQPWLATDWKWAPDYKAVTFNLRKGVKFQDGAGWNAQSAKWGLELLKKNLRNGTENWTSVSIIDDYTVRVDATGYDSSMMPVLAEYVFRSPAAWEQMGEKVAQWHPVGTGPFKFKSYAEDVSLVYERFDGYWGNRPYLDGVTYLYVADQATQLAGMQAGAAHILAASPKQAVEAKALGFNLRTGDFTPLMLAPDTNKPGSFYTN
ncbi:MAG: ABC transporter substrate-binding protein, partial [Chloroflexi bacterium]|nr:ABC transporter substrate-binding protein [Chloroflexota bacterium]